MLNRATGLGIVFGAGAGLLIASMTGASIPIWIALGACIGVVMGAAVQAMYSK